MSVLRLDRCRWVVLKRRNITKHDLSGKITLLLVMAPERTNRKRFVAHKISADVDVVHYALISAATGLSVVQFSRRSRFLAPRRTPVDSDAALTHGSLWLDCPDVSWDAGGCEDDAR